MCNDEDWLFRPVLARMFTADKLVDGSIDLAFVALCNEALDVQAENRHRVNKELQENK